MQKVEEGSAIRIEFFRPHKTTLTVWTPGQPSRRRRAGRVREAGINNQRDNPAEALLSHLNYTAGEYLQLDWVVKRIVGHSTDDHDMILRVALKVWERDVVMSLKFAMHA